MTTNYAKFNRTEILIVILILAIFAMLLWVSLTYGGGRVIIKNYDKDYNITGYTTIENGRESHFDKSWNRTGFSVPRQSGDRIDHYDRGWRRQGHSDIKREDKLSDDNSNNK